MNLRRFRNALSPRQCREIEHAWIEAARLGRPLNRMVTVRPLGDLSPVDHARLVDRFWNKLGGWSRYHGDGFYCVLVREKEQGGPEHFHVLVHVPPRKTDLFARIVWGWFDQIDDIHIRSATQHTFPLRVPGKLGSALGYITKQRTPQAAYRTTFLRRRGDPVLGKRYRITRNLLPHRAMAMSPVASEIGTKVTKVTAAA